MRNTTITTQLPAIQTQIITMVEKAIEIIRANCGNMQAQVKVSYAGNNDDCVTIADKLAQEMYLEEIRKHFPTFGIIAEEQELTIPCTDKNFDVYFTIDPLDGTKAFARKQSHGVGTMLALISDGNIVAVAIGDVNTGEVYTYANESEHCEVTRLRFGVKYQLEPEKKPLAEQYAFLLDHPREQPEIVRNMILPAPKDGGLFKDFEIGSGSIGLRFARLWKGEVGGIFLTPTFDTPWDLMPVLGITKKLGFKFLKIDGRALVDFEPEMVRTVTRMPHNLLIIHETHTTELHQWMQNQK